MSDHAAIWRDALRAAGTLDPEHLARQCSVDDCDRKVYSRGWCEMHYTRWRRNGTTDKPRRERGPCSVDGCDRPHKGHGFCEMHYERWRKTGDPMGFLKRRSSPPCSIDGCTTPSSALGLCQKHRRRLKHHGDPHYVTPPGAETVPIENRFWSKVEKTETCWLWSGFLSAGYGSIAESRADGKPGKRHMAHRISYEMHVGPIPDGLHLDHLCRVRRCVNPAHLEPVTAAENNRRSHLARAGEWHPQLNHGEFA